MKVTLINCILDAPEATATAYATDLTGKDPVEYVNKIRRVKHHHNIVEHNVFHLELYVTLKIAEIIGSSRLVSIVERSFRRTKEVVLHNPTTFQKQLKALYEELLADGVEMEDARYVLPDNVLITMRVTINQLVLETIIQKLKQAGHKVIASELADIITSEGYEIHDQKGVDWLPYRMVLLPGSSPRDVPLDTRETHPRFKELSKVTILKSLSRVAYQQLKRHRKSILIPCEYDTSKFYWPHKHLLFNEAERVASENKIIIGATKRQFIWEVDGRSRANFLRLRLDSHAQKEIRDFAERL